MLRVLSISAMILINGMTKLNCAFVCSVFWCYLQASCLFALLSAIHVIRSYLINNLYDLFCFLLCSSSFTGMSVSAGNCRISGNISSWKKSYMCNYSLLCYRYVEMWILQMDKRSGNFWEGYSHVCIHSIVVCERDRKKQPSVLYKAEQNSPLLSLKIEV